MAKPQVATIKPQKAPYVAPRIPSFKVDPKMISTDIDRLVDMQRQAQQEQEVKIGWKEYLAVAIGSILAYVFLRIMIQGAALDSTTHLYRAVTVSY